MRRSAIIAAGLVAACSNPLDEVRVLCRARERPAFCSDTCVPARRAADCSDELATLGPVMAFVVGPCLSACPEVDPCGIPSETYPACDCYAACLADLDPGFQEAYVDLFRCTTPPVCR